MSFQCVPLNPAWCDATKLDLRAVYQRPNGDLTTGLPLRAHSKWLAKGFAYVTLADAESFAIASRYLRADGKNPQDYVVGHENGQPTCWNAQAFLATQQVQQSDADQEIRDLIAEFGVQTVERIKGISVPAHLLEPVKAEAETVSEPAPQEHIPSLTSTKRYKKSGVQ